MNLVRNNRLLVPLVIAVAAVLITLSLTFTYVNGVLQGNFRHIFLPSKMWGIPEKVAAHGFDEFFQDDTNQGWDGQFYFFIANDPLALADTEQHIDSDAYRYQRIGLPLLANLTAKLSGQDWVSPTTYYITNLGLLFVATFLGAFFFRSRGINPCWILLWTLGMGTQVTQLHGLPDGAADALLIIALICLVNGRTVLYGVAATFAVLTREIYMLVPAAIILGGGILDARETGLAMQLRPGTLVHRLCKNWFHVLPLAIFVGWQVFIRYRFQISPSKQATNILDWPFKTSLQYMLAPLTGMRPMDDPSVNESLGILLFLAILLTAAWTLAKLIRGQLKQRHIKAESQMESITMGVSIAFLVMSLMYVCFGSTVMMDATGYWKATNVFMFFFPFLAALRRQRLGLWKAFLSLAAFALFSANLLARVLASPVATVAIAYAKTEPACLKNYSARIHPLSVEIRRKRWFESFLGQTAQINLNVEVTNTGNETWNPYLGKGGVNVSYQWINSSNGVIALDGIRTTLRAPLASGQGTQLPLTVDLPTQEGQYVLALTLVQEGCAWFYQLDPKSRFDIPYTIR
ncbi:hypothetical protein [Herbaspirillum rubrisubalbicans]|uniref:hypothetical protein n=1 Tax=Herbaspirillum rubrisubalbicans TaxID=80842 RepID=UPI0015C52A5F|nr:hypothetical protein [Herbaspirillum rubrisubalbicans]NQE51537.1 hypothetical protein [Herbaspirillum rubrisubalbicans]